MTTGYNIACALLPSPVSIPFYAIPISLSIIHRIFYLLVNTCIDLFVIKFNGVSAIVRVSSRKLYQGGSSVIIMKGGHNQMKSRCGFYSKLGYCEGVVEEFGGEVGELVGNFPPPPPSR